MSKLGVWCVIGALILAGWTEALRADHAAGPEFTKKPTVTKTGDKTQISFAVNRDTDVAVCMMNAEGKIVRHLVAGVLGNNPPEPLKAGTWEQSVEWDGKDDDGKTATGGPFTARVGLGLKANYAGQAFAEKDHTGPNRIESVWGMTTGADGRLYVLESCGSTVWSGSKVQVFRRDGSYEKTIQPFPANLGLDEVKSTGAFTNSFGGFNPLVYHPSGFAFYPIENLAQQPAMTPAGQLILAGVSTAERRGMHKGHTLQLAGLNTAGGVAFDTYAGPDLGAGLVFDEYAIPYPVLASAADSQTIYLAGCNKKALCAVYRVGLPGRGPAEVWFGDAAKAGDDNAHLGEVRGLAVDAKGHVLVADFGNNRVLAVNESDKSVAGTLAVQKPVWVGVHAKSGAVYVQSGLAMVKFNGWENAREMSRLELPATPYKDYTWRLAIDGAAETPVVWVACNDQLLRCEDQGDRFTALVPADCFAAKLFWRPSADPCRREILCKTTDGRYETSVRILNEETGAIYKVPGGTGKVGVAGLEGREHRLGPDGMIYAQDHAGSAGGVIRFDRNGKQVPFEATINDPLLKGRLPEGANGNSQWERDFTVDRKGDIYVKARAPEYHGLQQVHVYGQDGRLKGIPLQMVSDGMYGPRVDAQGNIYIFDAVKEPGSVSPQEFAGRMVSPRMTYEYDWMYGSVVKFGPAGGAEWFVDKQASPLTYEGWCAEASVKELHRTGGSLNGTIVKKPATLIFPNLRVDSAAFSKITFRLKNDSDGTQAILKYHRLDEGYSEQCGPGQAKTVEIKPNSDFTEYTFDMSEDKAWKGHNIWHLLLVPTNAAGGSFSIEWVRLGEADSKLAWNFNAGEGQDKKLPAGMAREHVGAFNRPNGATLEGALWWRPGFSPNGDMGLMDGSYCHCTGTDFDVDDFGRVFAPDACRFRVGVLDTNGNEIVSFGGYGNQDCCGPDSYVIDPASKLLRPRKEGDAANLESPSAKPEIGLGWIIGMAVTDKYVYVDDAINKRILRVKLDYAVSETVAVP